MREKPEQRHLAALADSGGNGAGDYNLTLEVRREFDFFRGHRKFKFKRNLILKDHCIVKM